LLTPFAIWLRDERTGREVSQDRLANRCREIDPKCGIYQARLYEWEQAKGRPSLRQLVVICGALGLSKEQTECARELRDEAELENLPTVPDGV
jgi:transcriptional regulator with XRE-family HTH domain